MKSIRRVWLGVLLVVLGSTLPLGSGRCGDSGGSGGSAVAGGANDVTAVEVAAFSQHEAVIMAGTTTAPAPVAAPAPPPPAAPESAPATAPSTFAGSNPPATQPGLPVSPLSLPSGARIVIIRIHDTIGAYMVDSVRQRIDRAVKGGASLIVFEFDTPGGGLHESIQLAREIKSCPVPTMAWIDREAYSGGSLLATACGSIVMGRSSMIGDCAPIVPGLSLPPTERANALSPLLAEFRDNARRNGYDYCLLQAMCMLGVEVYQVRNPATGETRLVNQADYRVLVQGDSLDAVEGVGTSTPLGKGTAARNTNAAGDDPTSVIPDIATDAQRGHWVRVRQVHDGRTLLTLNQTEAADLGLARGIIRNEAELQTYTRAAAIEPLDAPWGEGVAWWMTLPMVRGVLLVMLLVGVWLEFHTPGMMVGAIVAAIALVLLIVPPLAVGMAQVWHLALVAVGLVLLILEILPPPTFGALAVVGLVLMFVGLVLSAVPSSGNGMFNLPTQDSWGRLQSSIIWMLLGFIFSFVGFFFITKYFGTMPIVNKLILKSTSSAGLSGAAVAVISGGEALGSGLVAVGDEGRTVSDLRPTGRAEIGGQIVDVMTVGNWIGPGQPVRVAQVQGNRIIVDAVEQA